MPKPKPPVTPSTLKRESAGRYTTPDGRFAVEQASGGWMVSDAEQTNELGMPLVRGPFPTLEEARSAVEAAREGPVPTSDLAARIAALPPRQPGTTERTRRRATIRPDEPSPEPEPTPAPVAPPILIRAWQPDDGPAMRRLWDEASLRSTSDDDVSLAAMAQRNPGLLLVATAGDTVVGSALGAWDGRRGWIYHVATAPDHRRQGIGRRLVAAVEDGLRAVGCPKVNVIVLDDNAEGVTFWSSLGYTMLGARQFGRELSR